jgi:hypothetical protein
MVADSYSADNLSQSAQVAEEVVIFVPQSELHVYSVILIGGFSPIN